MAYDIIHRGPGMQDCPTGYQVGANDLATPGSLVTPGFPNQNPSRRDAAVNHAAPVKRKHALNKVPGQVSGLADGNRPAQGYLGSDITPFPILGNAHQPCRLFGFA